MRNELAIKLGSDEIVVYQKGQGILTRVPAYVALNKMGVIKYYGKDAYKRLNVNNQTLKICQPIKDGCIVDQNLAIKLLSNIFASCNLKSNLLNTNSAVVALPCGLTINELETVNYVLKMCGIDKMRIVQSGACAREFENIWDKKKYVCVVDIGASITDVSITSGEEFIAGADYQIGGVDMDEAIKVFVYDNYFATISTQTANEIKCDIGSLYNRDYAKTEFKGVADDGGVRDVEITAHEIRTAVSGIYDKIFALVKELIAEQGPNVINDIHNNGILFCGGVTQIAGFYEYAKQKFDNPVILSKNPLDAVLMGASKIIDIKDYPIEIKL